MPTRISAGVGDHPCFLTFYNYDPLSTVKFSLYLFVCFFGEITIIIFWCVPNKLLLENLLASTLHIQLIT